MAAPTKRRRILATDEAIAYAIGGVPSGSDDENAESDDSVGDDTFSPPSDVDEDDSEIDEDDPELDEDEDNNDNATTNRGASAPSKRSKKKLPAWKWVKKDLPQSSFSGGRPLEPKELEPVIVGSNCHSVGEVSACRRWDKKNKEYIEVPRPQLVNVYNQNMGGVDKADMLLSFYRNKMKPKKWYKRLLIHFLELSVVNAWLLYRIIKTSDMQSVDFRLAIAEGLMTSEKGNEYEEGESDEMHVQIPRKPRAKDVNTAKRYDCVGHWPQRSVQANASRCKLNPCKRKTRFMCMKCNVHLCVLDVKSVNYFHIFHSNVH